MRAEPRERLLEVEVARFVQHHGDEARVEQVQDRVLVATDVRRHRQPFFRDGLLERHIVTTDARVAQEIPGVVEEVVRDVGLAATRLAAFRTRDAVPLLMARQR